MDRRHFLTSFGSFLLAGQSLCAWAEPPVLNNSPSPSSGATAVPKKSIVVLEDLLPFIGDDVADDEARKALRHFMPQHRKVNYDRIVELFGNGLDRAQASGAHTYTHKATAFGYSVLTLFNEDRIDPIASRQNAAFFMFLKEKYLGRGTAETYTGNSVLASALSQSYRAHGRLPKSIDVEGVLSSLVVSERSKHDRILTAYQDVMGLCEKLNFPFIVAEKLFNAESSFDPLARNGSGNAVGLGQMQVPTWLSLISKLPSLPLGNTIMELLSPKWPDLEGISAALRHNKKLDKGTNQAVLAKREDTLAGASLSMALALENAETLRSLLGRNHRLSKGEIWLANVINPNSAASIIRAAKDRPNTLVNDVIANEAIIRCNPFLFGHPQNPLSVREVLKRANSPSPAVAFQIAQEVDVTILARRNRLIEGTPAGVSNKFPTLKIG